MRLFPERGYRSKLVDSPMPFCFVPHVNRLDLTRMALEALAPWKRHLVLVDNTGDAGDLAALCAVIIRPIHRMTFSQVQNWALGIARKIEAPYYAFCHNDALPIKQAPAALAEFAKLYRGKWGVLLTNYDSLCVFNTDALSTVGGWDENFPQYLADADMYLRLKRAGFPLVDTQIPVKHVPSQTIRADARLRFSHENLNGHLVDYYVRKWGGQPGRERFRLPWDGAVP